MRAYAKGRSVRAEFSAEDAHDFGRYLFDIGTRDNDLVWKDGEALVRAAHEALDGCPWHCGIAEKEPRP